MTEHQFPMIIPQVQCILVPTREYDALKKENSELKNTIYNLEHNADIFRQTIAKDKETIEILKKENAELKERIKILENKNIELEDKHKILEDKHKKLEDKFEESNKNLNKLMFKHICDKYIIAIQDLNREKQLESIAYPNTKKILQQLRGIRNDDCHYIYVDDDINLKEDKYVVLLDKINKMPKNIKNMFDKKYPDLLENITVFLIDNNNDSASISPTSLDSINEWWDE